MKALPSRELICWKTVHAVFILAVLADLALYPRPALVVPVLVVWGLGSFHTLSRMYHGRPRRSADTLSSIRLLTALSVTLTLYLNDLLVSTAVYAADSAAAALPAASAAGPLYVVFALLVGAEITDLLDGRVARAQGPTRFGSMWDEEIDAYFVLLLSVIAHLYFGLGQWILAAGALRYLYVLSLHAVPEAHTRPAGMAFFAKTACALMVISLIAVTFPPLPHSVAVQANAAAMGLLLVSFAWSWERNVSSWFVTAGRGLMRSFVLYYGVPLRARRRAQFYRRFLKPGQLAFDIGAHLGDRVRAWRRIGVRAVAVEPQPRFATVLRRLYPGHSGVTVVETAVGAQTGEAQLWISDAYPTVSTVARDWIDDVGATGSFAQVQWNRTVTVPLCTLDDLAEQYGRPDFVKIDVEGYEEAVLSGLSYAVPALSFEFLPAALDRAARCVEALERLDRYCYNVVVGESTSFLLDNWVGPEQITKVLLHSWPYDKSGDVYARRLHRAPARDRSHTAGRPPADDSPPHDSCSK